MNNLLPLRHQRPIFAWLTHPSIQPGDFRGAQSDIVGENEPRRKNLSIVLVYFKYRSTSGNERNKAAIMEVEFVEVAHRLMATVSIRKFL